MTVKTKCVLRHITFILIDPILLLMGNKFKSAKSHGVYDTLFMKFMNVL